MRGLRETFVSLNLIKLKKMDEHILPHSHLCVLATIFEATIGNEIKLRCVKHD